MQNFRFNISFRCARNIPPEMSADFVHIKNSNVKAIAKDYSVSSPGTIDYYSVWRHSGDNVYIYFNTFNGNNTFDYTPYQPSGSNAYVYRLRFTILMGPRYLRICVLKMAGTQ